MYKVQWMKDGELVLDATVSYTGTVQKIDITFDDLPEEFTSGFTVSRLQIPWVFCSDVIKI